MTKAYWLIHWLIEWLIDFNQSPSHPFQLDAISLSSSSATTTTTVRLSINHYQQYSPHDMLDQSINQSINQPTNQSTNQKTTNQPNNQPTNQPINQSINHRKTYLIIVMKFRIKNSRKVLKTTSVMGQDAMIGMILWNTTWHCNTIISSSLPASYLYLLLKAD